MFDRDLWAEIFHSIKKNKLRTFLTGFSVAWGIFILVLLLASVNGMQNGFKNQFNDDAPNVVFINPSATTLPYAGFESGRKIKLTNKDLAYIKGNFKNEIEYITPRLRKFIVARYKNQTGSYPLKGVNQDHQYTEKTKISIGRYINQNDIDKKLKVVVIGRKIAKDLFGDQQALGKSIELNKSIYTIIGIFTDDKDSEERVMYAPITTIQRLYKNTNEISRIVLTYNPKFSFMEATNFIQVLETVLKRRHQIAPDDQGAIYFNDNIEEFTDISNFSIMLKVISVIVGFLILLAGIVGIGNILVFIIKERTKEIGIRKALGAKPSQIINLVLLESVFITSISGMGGMLFAFILVKFVGANINTPAFSNPSVDMFTVIIAGVVLIVAGVLAGLIPAIRAANVKPIVALRAD